MKLHALLSNLVLEEALEREAKMPKTHTVDQKKQILKKAYNTLILSLGNKELRKVSKMKTAAEILLKLESLYMIKSLSSQLYLKVRFFTFEMNDG